MIMKRILLIFVACIVAAVPSWAVLKERDLARTLGVLRAELQADYRRQQAFMARYEQQGAAQHEQLVWYMNQCEQIGLMIYSQTLDNTFDMAYACQQAVNLYRQLDNRSGRSLPYDKVIALMRSEIERYDSLITSLNSIPPVLNLDSLSESDSHLLGAIDSLEAKVDTSKSALPDAEARPLTDELPEEGLDEPLFLTGQQLKDRAACLHYAQVLRDNMEHFLESMEAESSYYQSVQQKVRELGTFAQSRYKMLQDNIYRNGGPNYFSILSRLPAFIQQARRSAATKYAPFKGHGSLYSEWRGVPVLFISLFVLIYLAGALLLSYVILHWLLPRRWRKPENKQRRQVLTFVIGIALFAIAVMVVRHFVERNFIQMSTALIITMAWLLEVIFLSIFIRLKGDQMRHAALIYTPLMVLSSLVIMLRVVLVPNSILNLVFPPVLLAFTLWQWFMVRRHRRALPLSDVIYSHITTFVMVVSCIASWVGYTLLSVQVLVWWMFQLAAIMTVTCLYDIMSMFENRYMLARLKPELRPRILAGEDVEAEAAPLLKAMEQGKFITTTWVYDFCRLTLVPILAVASVLVSIYWSADIFEMTSICEKAFFKNFIDQKDLVQISLAKLCLVAALWFVFRYLNYAIRSFYVYFRKHTGQDESINTTLARNIIAIVCWGLYIITVFVILNVPKSGISIVTAGLATGLGFAMQDLIENFFYGLSLMTGRLRVGDYIECDGITGKVESITYQSTQVVTLDGYVISFLNKALFNGNFKNMTRNHSYAFVKVPVGVAYGTDVARVRSLLIEALKPLAQERNAADKHIIDPVRKVDVIFSDFGDSSVDLYVALWMLVEERTMLLGRVKEIIYQTLTANGIEIPFPQREVKIVQG